MAEALGALDSAQVAAIRATRERHVRLALAADWRSFVEIYEERAFVMPPNSQPLDSRSQLLAFAENFPRIEKLRIAPGEIDGRADLAYERGFYDMTFTSGVSDRGSYLTLWRKQDDGSWMIFRDIWHSDLAPSR